MDAGTWVVEEAVLPFLYYATLHQDQAVAVALGDPDNGCLAAVVRYCKVGCGSGEPCLDVANSMTLWRCAALQQLCCPAAVPQVCARVAARMGTVLHCLTLGTDTERTTCPCRAQLCLSLGTRPPVVPQSPIQMSFPISPCLTADRGPLAGAATGASYSGPQPGGHVAWGDHR